MKHENGYWIDENNNCWSDDIDEVVAQKRSDSLIDCRDCRDCWDCHGCENYIESPMQYVTSRIGSRNDQTVFCFGTTREGKSLQVVCGCFRGDLKEFEVAVLKTHKDNDVYRNQYLKEIQKVKALFELEEEKQ